MTVQEFVAQPGRPPSPGAKSRSGAWFWTID